MTIGTTGITSESLRRLDRRIVFGSLLGLTGICWWVMLRTHAPLQGMVMPHHAPSGAAGFGAAFLLWMVMMAAMMLPAAMPWILFFSTLSRDRTGDAPHFSVGMFVGGYLAAWAGYCVAAAGAQQLLLSRALIGGHELRVGSVPAGLLLVTAGLFQWSSWKESCLRHCRTPLSFFLAEWRDGPTGAFRMGLRHGLFCLGCCWALMALSFALGVMNLLWMAAITLILCVEKIAPRGDRFGRGLGVVLVLWGGLLLATALR